jgi:FtsH-binding integral membrane protein
VAGPASVTFNGTVPEQTTAADAFLSMLAPFWRLVLSCAVLLFVLATAARLARRGRSRMNTALLVAGTGIVALVLLGMLLALTYERAAGPGVGPMDNRSPGGPAPGEH